MNHVAKLTEFFVKKEQDISVNMMITYNIPFNFIVFLDFPIMRNFLTFLIGNMYHHSYLNIKNQVRLWKYFSITNFFIDLANLMLFASTDKFPQEKNKEGWHPYDVSSFIVQKELKNDPSIDNKKDDHDDVQISLFEEYSGFRTDIDRLKNVIHGKKTYLISRVVNQINTINKLKSLELFTMDAPVKANVDKRTNTEGDISEKVRQIPKKKQSIRISSWKKQQTIDYNKETENSSPKNEADSSKRISTLPSPIKKSGNDSVNESGRKIREKGKFKSMTFFSEMKNKVGGRGNQNFQLTNDEKKMIPSITPFNSKNPSRDLKSLDFRNNSINTNIGSPTAKNFVIRTQNTNNLKKIINQGQKNKLLELAKQQQPYLTEAIEVSRMKTVIKELYPTSLHFIKETDVDRKSRDPAFSVDKIIENDYYAIYIAEILSVIIKNAVENYTNYNIKKKIEYVQKDYNALFIALFTPEDGKVLELLFEVIIY